MSLVTEKNKARKKRHRRVRKKVFGTSERPRLCVFRSSAHIYAQVIDDSRGTTLAEASSLGKGILKGKSGGNISAAEEIGKAVAKKALAKGVKKVVFDRGGFIFHGRIKRLADAAREAGLIF